MQHWKTFMVYIQIFWKLWKKVTFLNLNLTVPCTVPRVELKLQTFVFCITDQHLVLHTNNMGLDWDILNKCVISWKTGEKKNLKKIISQITQDNHKNEIIVIKLYISEYNISSQNSYYCFLLSYAWYQLNISFLYFARLHNPWF